MKIRPEHRELITKANGVPLPAAFSNYPESSISALVIADEMRRSTDRICKALAEINKTLNKMRESDHEHWMTRNM
jgi:hypothetical protein